MPITIIEPQKQPEVMRDLQFLSLAQVLHTEVKFPGMRFSRSINALDVARRYGFEGTRKKAALHWTIKQMEDRGMTLPPTLATWKAEN